MSEVMEHQFHGYLQQLYSTQVALLKWDPGSSTTPHVYPQVNGCYNYCVTSLHIFLILCFTHLRDRESSAPLLKKNRSGCTLYT